MQRTFLSNLSLLLILNLLIKPAYLLLVEAEVQNRVGAETFGNYAALLNLSFLLNIFLDLGINTFTSRTIARGSQSIGGYFSSVALLRLLLALLYLVLLVGAALLLRYQFDDLRLLAWLGMNQILAAGLLYLRANLTGMMLFSKDAFISVLDRALLLIGIGTLLIFTADGRNFDIRWFVYGQTIAYTIGTLTALFFVLQKSGQLKLRWRPMFIKVILNQSLPYALLVLLMMVYYKTDAVMLERMLPDGDYQSGVYAMGYRIFEASNMVGYLFATLLLPIFSKMFKNKEDPSELTDHALRLIITGGGTLAIASAFWPEEILGIIYDAEISAASGAFKWLMSSFLFMMLTYLWGTLLTANGNMRQMNRIAAFAVLLNIGLNLVLIPHWKSEGSALASLATQVLVAAAQIALCYRLLRIKNKRSTWFRIIGFMGLLLSIAFLLTIIDLPWELELAVFLFSAIIGAFTIGLLRMVYIQSLWERPT